MTSPCFDVTALHFIVAFQSRLRTRLDFDSTNEDDVELTSSAAQRIAMLEENVIDVDAANRKLERDVSDALERETTLLCRIEDLQRGDVTSGVSGSEAEREKYWKLLETIQNLERSESSLKTQMDSQQTEEAEKMKEVKPSKTCNFLLLLTVFYNIDYCVLCLQRIAELERSERALTVQLSLVTSQPDDVINATTSDGDRLERHLRQQVHGYLPATLVHVRAHMSFCDVMTCFCHVDC